MKKKPKAEYKMMGRPTGRNYFIDMNSKMIWKILLSSPKKNIYFKIEEENEEKIHFIFLLKLVWSATFMEIDPQKNNSIYSAVQKFEATRGISME